MTRRKRWSKMSQVRNLLQNIFKIFSFKREQSISDDLATSPQDALQLLREGNKRFISSNFERPNQNKELILQLEKEGQHPFAVIVGCSDSRVPLTHIFDRGFGDLFEIKNAGNVIDDHVIGSVEYALSYLDVKLVVILGHSNCGFIKTALAHPKGDSRYFNSIVKELQSAIELSARQDGDIMYNVTKNNAIAYAKTLVKKDKSIFKQVKRKGVEIIPAYYNGESGKVEFFLDEKVSAENLH